MKKAVVLLVLLTIFAGYAAAEIVERIVARVNDEIVTMYDIRQKINDLRFEYKQMRKTLPRGSKRLRKLALDKLINNLLVMQKAKKDGVVISRVEVEDRLEKQAKRQKMTMAQFKKELQKKKITYQQYFDQIRKELIIRKLFQKAAKKDKKFKPTDADIQAYYNKLLKTKPKAISMFRVQHIFIYLHPSAGFTKRMRVEKRIEGARQALKRGSSLGYIARRYRARFKDFGFIIVKRGLKLPRYVYPIFGKSMFKGKKKDFKIVNEVPGWPGYHALKIVDVKPIPLEKVKNTIRGLLLQKKMAESLDNWIKSLRKSARIAINT